MEIEERTFLKPSRFFQEAIGKIVYGEQEPGYGLDGGVEMGGNQG